ncbi:hypothetical protein CYMTET_45984, partial [Cymbomonas tetramitiformis]
MGVFPAHLPCSSFCFLLAFWAAGTMPSLTAVLILACIGWSDGRTDDTEYKQLSGSDGKLFPYCGLCRTCTLFDFGARAADDDAGLDDCKQRCDSVEGCNVIIMLHNLLIDTYMMGGMAPHYYKYTQCQGRACPDCFYVENNKTQTHYSEGCKMGDQNGYDIYLYPNFKVYGKRAQTPPPPPVTNSPTKSPTPKPITSAPTAPFDPVCSPSQTGGCT